MKSKHAFTSALAGPLLALYKEDERFSVRSRSVELTIVTVGPPENHGQLHGVCANIGMHTVLAGEVMGVGSHMVANRLVHAVEHFRGRANVNKDLQVYGDEASDGAFCPHGLF